MLRRGITAAAVALITSIAIGCGGTGGTDSVATAPDDPNAEVSGTLRVFAYEDSVRPEMIDPVTEANPDLKIETATFDSNEEAAAKLAGGFDADVVEICLDEMKPLVDQKLIRPLDPDGLVNWDDLSYTNADGIVIDGQAYGVPLSAGLEGLVYNPEEVPGGIDENSDLWDPQFAGRSTIQGGYALIPIATAALALGIEDPMNMSEEDLDRTKQYLLDHARPVPHALGLRLGSGQPLQVGRGGGRLRRPAAPAADRRCGRPGQVGVRQGRNAVLGLRVRAHLERAEHPRRLRPDELAVLTGGAGDPGQGRLPGHEPQGTRPRPEELREDLRRRLRRQGDPRDLSADLPSRLDRRLQRIQGGLTTRRA